MSAKSPAKKKVATKSTHPMYKEMIAAAIKALANRKGSSKLAISKYIEANYKVGGSHERLLRSALLRGLESGALVKKSGLGCAGSFRLAKVVAAPKKVAAKKAAPKKTATPKKKAAPKKKVGAKKAAPKKKAATPKKKAAPKKKVAAAKKKPAAKKATPKKAKK